MTLKDRKYISNFDIGKNQITSSGRLTSTPIDMSSFSSTPSYTGYDKAASSYRLSIVPTVANGIGSMATNASGLLSNYTSLAAADAANISAAASTGMSQINAATGSATKMTGDAAAKVLSENGMAVTKAGLSSLGYVTGIAGTALGAYNTINALLNFENRTKDTDMLAGSSITTQTKYGRSYKQYGGFDENGILNLTNALNSSDLANTAMSAASTGMSLGGTIGSIFPGVGNVIGMGLGAIFGGLFGGIFGSGAAAERERKVKSDIKNTKEAIGGYNVQSESEAGSAGLRDMFNAKSGQPTTGILRADSGKTPNDKGVQGYMSKDETWYNPTADIMNQVGYPGSTDFSVKDKREDNVPMYGNIDPISVLGHKIATGDKYYADLGRPFGKRAEQIRERFNSTNDSNEKLNLMLEMNLINKNVAAIALMLQEDSERKEMKHTLNYRRINADKGKVPRYVDGKPSFSSITKSMLDYIWPTVGAGLQLSNLIGYKNFVNSLEPLKVESAYVPANTKGYLNALASLREDPSNELKALNTAARLSIYNTDQSAGLGSGLKSVIKNNAIKNLFASRGLILADYARRNIGYKQAWAQAGIQDAQSAATRAQQANLELINAWRQSVGAKNNLTASLYRDTPTVFGSIMQGFDTANWKNKMYNLWNNQLDSDRYNAGMTDSPKSAQLSYTGTIKIPTVSLAPVNIQNPLGWRSALYTNDNVNPYAQFDYRNKVSLGG